mgnify:CR=1 FL=1
MLTNRQRLIIEQIKRGHSVEVHFSPREIARRIGLFGDHAVRLEIGRMIIDGEIISVDESRGTMPARYRIRDCRCVHCLPN